MCEQAKRWSAVSGPWTQDPWWIQMLDMLAEEWPKTYVRQPASWYVQGGAMSVGF